MAILKCLLLALAILHAPVAADDNSSTDVDDNQYTLPQNCEDDPPTDPCPDYSDYVCGSNDRDFKNICLLHNESLRRVANGEEAITLAYVGPCKCDCGHCPECYKPVCGTDGFTYWNICWLNCYDKCGQARDLPSVSQANSGYCQV